MLNMVIKIPLGKIYCLNVLQSERLGLIKVDCNM